MPGIPYVSPRAAAKHLLAAKRLPLRKRILFHAPQSITFMASELQAAPQAHDLARKESIHGKTFKVCTRRL